MVEDDFEELVRGKGARSLAACTLGCSEIGRPGRKGRVVAITFREALLPREVLDVLRARALSAAYSPGTRTLRVRADDRGAYHVSRAPRTTDVWILRVPYSEKMPWVARRAAVEVDVNPGQGSIFIEWPGAEAVPPRDQHLALPAPASQRLPAPATVPQQRLRPVAVPSVIKGVRLSEEEADLLTILSADAKHTRAQLAAQMELAGHRTVSVPGLVARLRGRLDPLGICVATDETPADKDQWRAWLGPAAQARLRELVAPVHNSDGR